MRGKIVAPPHYAVKLVGRLALGASPSDGSEQVRRGIRRSQHNVPGLVGDSMCVTVSVSGDTGSPPDANKRHGYTTLSPFAARPNGAADKSPCTPAGMCVQSPSVWGQR